MSLKLQTPNSFSAFPFVPYEIQMDLMRHLYASIEDRKVTIVESPTGTGKTLSLLCASLTWLKDEQQRARNGQLDTSSEGSDGSDWVLAQTLNRRRRELEAEEREYAERLAVARKKEAAMRKLANARIRKKPKLASSVEVSVNLDDDANFLPEDEDGGDSDRDEHANLSPAVRALMAKLKQGTTTATEAQDPVCTKVYYASRTHSQLAQVLHELRKLRLPLNISVSTVSPTGTVLHGAKRHADLGEEDGPTEACNARVVSLGSRRQLCINETLRGRAGDLDEACRQILSEKGKKRCEHLPPMDEEIRMLDLRDQILATPKDIEDLVLVGQASSTCPYFGSRRAIPQAQLVLLPYNLLLQKTAREALGIDLTDQVVIIDEAHNLIATLLSLSTVRLLQRTLATARHQLGIYLTRFRTRLAHTHALHLMRLSALLDALVRYAEEWRAAQKAGASTEVMTPGELLERLGRTTAGINLLEIDTYLRSSKIARKISGYSVKALEKAAGQDPSKLAKLARLGNTTPPLHAVESFIVALTSANDDGRVALSLVDGQVELKYQHLNPATHFADVIDAARAVVLAGGTMSPISDVTSQLFAQLPRARLADFACGHIVPPTSLQTLVLKRGPRGRELQFKYEQRGDQELIAELGQILLNFASIVPGGMVVFVPSYSFLHAVRAAWDSSGLSAKLAAKKKVFSEPQESGQVEAVLRDYAAAVHAPPPAADGAGAKKGGALLFAVIGAKLSEGLNFTDDLARAVVLVGLPFANLASPELRERMRYVNRLEQRRGVPRPAGGAKDAAAELYENMCMNAVNQSIGRAIRHKDDWAALVLVDARYGAPRIRSKLPKWIGGNTVVAEGFGQAMKEMGRFYREKRAI